MRIKEDDNNIKIVHFLGHTPLGKLPSPIYPENYQQEQVEA